MTYGSQPKGSGMVRGGGYIRLGFAATSGPGTNRTERPDLLWIRTILLPFSRSPPAYFHPPNKILPPNTKASSRLGRSPSLAVARLPSAAHAGKRDSWPGPVLLPVPAAPGGTSLRSVRNLHPNPSDLHQLFLAPRRTWCGLHRGSMGRW